MRLLLVAMALLALGAPSAAWATDDKPAVCEDHTPHKARFVKVAPGVQLEVLDFGGSGEPMVLLTGIGDNAHVWDEFAYQFTDYFRVIGITRRGFGASDKPSGGYDVPTRAHDDIAVLDAFGIGKAVFVGHSIAGSELSRLGLAHPRRVEKLVYLDALDRAEVPREEQELPPPPFTDADSSSLRALQAAVARLQGNREPDAAFCNTFIFDRSGRLVDNVTPEAIRAKVFAGAGKSTPTDWRKIGAPRLGIFALLGREARQAYYWYLSPAEQAEFDAGWGRIVDWDRRTIGRFAEGNRANTFLLPNAPHYIYISNEAEVVRWMRDFLGIPPRS
ncbi:MAG: alpha/beta hydrolase [Geminicoccaceae bacterium]